MRESFSLSSLNYLKRYVAYFLASKEMVGIVLIWCFLGWKSHRVYLLRVEIAGSCLDLLGAVSWSDDGNSGRVLLCKRFYLFLRAVCLLSLGLSIASSAFS